MKILNFNFTAQFNRGQTLIELVLVMGIAAIIIPAIFTGLIASRGGASQQGQRAQATALLKETEEAVKNVRNNSWNAFSGLSPGSSYHTQIANSKWELVSGTQTTNGFTQNVIISNVYRDSNGAITQSGILDPSTKKVDIKITWGQPYSSTLNSSLYLTRTSNLTFTQTTKSDFTAGIASNSAVVSTGGSATDGQIQLATNPAGGNGGGSTTGGPLADWCRPDLSITALDLPKNGVANAISAIEGRVFAGTGENASGVSFANVNISNTNPPDSSTAGTFNGYKTNGVFGESDYAYLATDTNSKEIEIIDLSASPYTEIGYFNAPGNGSANSVYVSGNIGYMTSGNKLYTFDLSSKSGSRPQLASLTLDGTGNKIFVKGNYVYVAIGSTSNQLEIIQISNNGSTLTKSSSFSLSAQAAQDVYVNSAESRAYVATAVSASQKELFVVNISNKTSPSILGSFDSSGMNPTGITVVTRDNKAILVGIGGEEYQVIDISNETSPTRCGGLNIDTGIRGVSSIVESDSDAYSYIVTGDASAELKVIQGGPGGGSNAPNANWCSPQTSVVNTLTLPRAGNSMNAVTGNAYIGSGDGTSGASFIDVAVSNTSSGASPSASVRSAFSGNSQTNGAYSDGANAYLAVNGSSSQVLILNIATTPFTQVGTITVPGGLAANGVFVKNNIAYITSGSKLYTFDVSTKSGSHTSVLTSADIYGENGATPTAKQITVVGSKAYVGAAGTIYGLQSFLVGTNGTSLRLVGVSNLSNPISATGLTVNQGGTRGYLAFDNGSGSISKGFIIVDTSTADQPVWWPLPNFYNIIGTYSSGNTDPNGIALGTGTSSRVLLTGTGGTYQYHAVDVSIETDPLLCGGLAIPEGSRGVSTVSDQFNRVFSYLITAEASSQFKIIQGGAGGGSYKEDGTFESSTYNSGGNTAYNRVFATVAKPSSTTIRMQVASAPPIGGSCTGASYSYVGPDGSATSFFTPIGTSISAGIPFGSYSPNFQNPAQCFRYKTWFTTWDTSQTPVFNEITVNYSP